MHASFRVLVSAAAALLVLCGCSGNGSGESDGRRNPERQTTTTQPAAADAVAVRPYLQDLLDSWDEAMTPILADPETVAEDPDHRLRHTLAESFTDDSPYVGDLGELLEGYISQDTGIRPGPSGQVQQTTLLDITRTPDDDHISFVFCTFTDGTDYSLSTGDERPATVGIRQGAGDATRVEGRWLLHRLQRLGFESQPAGTPNPCPDLAGPEASAG